MEHDGASVRGGLVIQYLVFIGNRQLVFIGNWQSRKEKKKRGASSAPCWNSCAVLQRQSRNTSASDFVSCSFAGVPVKEYGLLSSVPLKVLGRAFRRKDQTGTSRIIDRPRTVPRGEVIVVPWKHESSQPERTRSLQRAPSPHMPSHAMPCHAAPRISVCRWPQPVKAKPARFLAASSSQRHSSKPRRPRPIQFSATSKPSARYPTLATMERSLP